jgi:hypothetical protein
MVWNRFKDSKIFKTDERVTICLILNLKRPVLVSNYIHLTTWTTATKSCITEFWIKKSLKRHSAIKTISKLQLHLQLSPKGNMVITLTFLYQIRFCSRSLIIKQTTTINIHEIIRLKVEFIILTTCIAQIKILTTEQKIRQRP